MKRNRIAAGLLAMTMLFSTSVTVSAEGFFLSDNFDISNDNSAVVFKASTYGDFEYSVSNNGTGTVTITDYKGNDSEVTIPDTINGKKVTSIGIKAFDYSTKLTKIIIPDSITYIGDLAFYECSKLSEVTIPYGVTTINSSTFRECTSLTEITIPNSVTVIKDDAFYGCKSLERITIPNSVKSIECGAFKGCSSITKIAIPSSITSIESGTFYACESLKSIDIPNSITSIGHSAFYGCSNLTNLNIPNSVTIIDNYAFYGCSQLTNMIIPNKITGISNYVFYDCKNLVSIQIPNSVKNIEMWAFYGCTNLKDVYYTGSKSDWQAINIESYNSCLTDATTIHFDYVPPHTHTYKTTVVAPTFESQGYTLHECSECGHSYKDNYTSKKTVGTTALSSFSSSASFVTINWNKAANASGYRIYRYNTSTKKWNTVATLSGADTLTYKQTGLKSGTTYKYKVKAYAKSGGKTYWGEASETMTTTTKPAKPVIKSSYSATSNAIRIKWTPVTGATGYRVYRYDAKTKKYVVIATIKDGSANTYRDGGRKAKTSYQYKVKAYRKLGDVNYWSEASAAKTCKTK